MNELNTKQKEACISVIEGSNILLTGPAGTGKSYTVKHIIDILKESGKKYAMTATTGTAAVLIGGQTLHSFMGVGLGSGNVIENIKRIRKHPNTYRNLQELEVLIIDEISMLDADFFDKISDILSTIKANFHKNQELLSIPFGGIQLILIGDFCQLAPVNGYFCFLSKTWKNMNIKVILLDEIIRQSDDILFQKLLKIVRKGKCTDNIMKVLNTLKDTEFIDGIKPTKLYPINVDVDKINNMEVAKLKEQGNETHIYKASGSEDKLKHISKYDVELTMEAQVMITRNIDITNGLVNGKRGVIIYLGTDHVVIKDKNNNSYKIEYFKDVDEKSNKSYISHMPVKICYALSIHKSQGMTIDALELDLGKNIFTYGQAYTALSRAKTLNSIKIIDIDKNAFKINSFVKKFYDGIVDI